MASSALESNQAVPAKSSKAIGEAAGKVADRSRKAVESASSRASGALATAQGLLASALSTDFNALLQDMVTGSATIHDKAMGTGYFETGVGGDNHRIFDGGHTIAGAIEAVRGASSEDTIVPEAMEFLERVFKDMTTPNGLPLAT